jgi:uncharacterized membrane protein
MWHSSCSFIRSSTDIWNCKTPRIECCCAIVLSFLACGRHRLSGLGAYKNDKFVRFHAFQSIFLSIAYFVFMVLWSGILWSILGGSFWFILGPIGLIVRLGVLLLWIFLMYKAYNNEKFMIPFIGELAAKQAG